MTQNGIGGLRFRAKLLLLEGRSGRWVVGRRSVNSQTRPAYTAAEFSEITGLSVEEAARRGGRAAKNPERRVFSWRDALGTLSLLIRSDVGGGGRLAGYGEAEEVLRNGGMAWRDLDGRIQHISIDPDRLSGIPEIAGTRVHAMFVGLEAERPGGRKILTRSYDLTPEQIEDAVRWSRQALSYAGRS